MGAAAQIIECNNDKDGISWPLSVAPFTVVVIPLNYNEEQIKEIADTIYQQLQDQGVEVLLDDRDERAGIKFKDADLIGIPVKLIIGKKNLANGQVEIKLRRDGSTQLVSPQSAREKISAIIAGG